MVLLSDIRRLVASTYLSLHLLPFKVVLRLENIDIIVLLKIS